MKPEGMGYLIDSIAREFREVYLIKKELMETLDNTIYGKQLIELDQILSNADTDMERMRTSNKKLTDWGQSWKEKYDDLKQHIERNEKINSIKSD